MPPRCKFLRAALFTNTSHCDASAGLVLHSERSLPSFAAALVRLLRVAPLPSEMWGCCAYQCDWTSLHPALPCVDQTASPGLWLEFGVFEGKTLRVMSRYAGQQRSSAPSIAAPSAVWGFDSFAGLPERWRSSHGDMALSRYIERGAFDRGGRPPFAETAQLRFVVGWYNETLRPFLEQHRGPVSVLHIDCDLYSAARTVFSLLRDRIRAGTILILDEVVNYPEYLEGELKALHEWLGSRPDLALQVLATSTRTVPHRPTTNIIEQSCAFRVVRRRGVATSTATHRHCEQTETRSSSGLRAY